MSDVTGTGDQAGTAYTVRRGPGAARTTILEAEPPRRYVSRTEAYLGLRFELTSELAAEDGGCRLSITAETRWPRALKLIGRLVEFVLLNEREAQRELSNLKALVEREPPQVNAQADIREAAG